MNMTNFEVFCLGDFAELIFYIEIIPLSSRQGISFTFFAYFSFIFSKRDMQYEILNLGAIKKDKTLNLNEQILCIGIYIRFMY